MIVSWHVRCRYWLRVNATVIHPESEILLAWYDGAYATDDQLGLYYCDREPGKDYKICRLDGLDYLLISEGGVIKTLLELYLPKGIVKQSTKHERQIHRSSRRL